MGWGHSSRLSVRLKNGFLSMAEDHMTQLRYFTLTSFCVVVALKRTFFPNLIVALQVYIFCMHFLTLSCHSRMDRETINIPKS